MNPFSKEDLDVLTSPLANKLYWWGFALLISYGLSGGSVLVGGGVFVLVLLAGRVLRVVVDFLLGKFENGPLEQWYRRRDLRNGWGPHDEWVQKRNAPF